MMTTSSITPDQARALATLIHELRPDWTIPGISAALWNARDRSDEWTLALTAIRAARTATNRTPAVIAMDGPHWTDGKAKVGDVSPLHFARCTQPGHTSYPAWNCGACRADGLETERLDQAPRTPAVPATRVREILDATTQGEHA
jgi:hypothetical protein